MKERDRRRASRRADNATYAAIARECRRKLVLASSSRVEIDTGHFVEAERLGVRVPRSLREESRAVCEDCVADIAISDEEFRGSDQVSVDHYDCCDEIVCPYCGKSPNYSEECDGGDEGTFECECGHCEKTFHYSRNVSISYSSWRKE